MQLADFDYDLPAGLIAQFPTPQRTGSKLLHLSGGRLVHRSFPELKNLLRPGDLLVLNNTRVLNARLHATKDSGGQAEVMLERLLDEHRALAQVRVSKPLKAGRELKVDDYVLRCVGRQGQFYELVSDEPILTILEACGHVPLPPYIERDDDSKLDAERYQTVFGKVPGAVAAPTAGLHFSESFLAELRDTGVQIAEVTLHVGAGTFAPVRGDLDEHIMHQEWYSIDESVAQQIAEVKASGGRVVAVGTTVIRTLEDSALRGDGQVVPGAAQTRLFIRSGFEFNCVDALVTNFHLPKSTLLMLICAFAGYDAVMDAYRVAVQEQYRFFSYGDAMFVDRANV